MTILFSSEPASLIPETYIVALIAAGASVLGIVISSQSKISEFRQSWINALREDIAKLITHGINLHNDVTVLKKPNLGGVSLLEVNEASARIHLLLNPKEDESQSLNDSLDKFTHAVQTDAPFPDIEMCVNAVISATQVVLKKEWERVKSGEFLYRWAFRISSTAMVLILISMVYRFYKSH